MHGNPVEIYRTRTAQEAHMLRNRLADMGIEALVTNDVLERGSGIDLLGWPTDARVLVDERDAEAARQIAVYFEQSRAAADARPAEAATPAVETMPWPVCPACGKRRTTSCPACGTSGSDFRPGDAAPGDAAPAAEGQDAGGPIVICPTCDEPLAPKYLRQCEWCGHEFEPGAEPAAEHPEPLGTRVVAAIVALVAIGIVALVYLAMLFQ